MSLLIIQAVEKEGHSSAHLHKFKCPEVNTNKAPAWPQAQSKHHWPSFFLHIIIINKQDLKPFVQSCEFSTVVNHQPV